MADKEISAATAKDAALCNTLDPPLAGCHAGPGIHVVIPPDFAARILAGQDVPGCTYARLAPVLDVNGVQVDTKLRVTDAVQTKLAIPSEISKLTAQQQTDAAALQTKLATAVVVTAAIAEELP